MRHAAAGFDCIGAYLWLAADGFRMILLGFPTLVEFDGISLITTVPAPILTSFPMFTFSTMLTCGPIYTLSPITAGVFLLEPIDRKWDILQF